MNTTLPASVSGVIPAFAQKPLTFTPPCSECGVGCLMPPEWQAPTSLNYVSHRRKSGTGTGLRVIDGDFKMTRHPDGVDGTYANRFVHYEFQLAHHRPIISSSTRTTTSAQCGGTYRHPPLRHRPPSRRSGQPRLHARHGGRIESELNVHTLESKVALRPHPKCSVLPVNSNATSRIVTPIRSACRSEQRLRRGRLSRRSKVEGTARRNGTARTGGCLSANPSFAFMAAANLPAQFSPVSKSCSSAILKVFTDADKTPAHLPTAQGHLTRARSQMADRMALHTAKPTTNVFCDLHGMFYELSPWAYGQRIWGVKPISQHLWVHGDFCTWKGMLRSCGR